MNMKRMMLIGVAVEMVAAGAVLAQYRIDNRNALDANNRLGSSGYNEARLDNTYGRQNYIITGNVTAGRAFRGSIGYTDPRAFRGLLPSSTFDNFVRDSSGISTRGTPSFNANTVRPFFGVGRGVGAPAGFRQDVGGGGYVPGPGAVYQPADTRLDAGGLDRSVLARVNPPPLTIAPALRSDPLSFRTEAAQLRDFSALDYAGMRALSDFTSIHRPSVPSSPAGVNVNALRNSLTKPAATTPAEPPSPDFSTGQTVGFGPAVTGPVNPNDPRQILKDRLALLESRPRSATQAANEAAADFAREMAARQAALEAAVDAPTPAPNAGTIVPPVPTVAPTVTTVEPMPEALVISSLVPSASTEQIGQMVAGAEVLMRSGQYQSAIDAFERVQAVAPTDQMINVGRAIAELGAGYYRMSEERLLGAFSADRSLLVARFDLRSILGDERLEFLVADLRKLATDQPDDPAPLFLLAFIDYGAGNSSRASAYLQKAASMESARPELADVLRVWSGLSGPSK